LFNLKITEKSTSLFHFKLLGQTTFQPDLIQIFSPYRTWTNFRSMTFQTTTSLKHQTWS